MNDQRAQNFHANDQSYTNEHDEPHQANFYKNPQSVLMNYKGFGRNEQEISEPFHIKTEQEDKHTWNGRQAYMENENSMNSGGVPSAHSNQTSQNVPLDIYNNPLFYQNNFQSVFPLDFYGRHQALANSFLSSYSNANNPNLMVHQYLQQCTSQQVLNNFNTLKESNSNTNQTHFINAKKNEMIHQNPTDIVHQNANAKYNTSNNTYDAAFDNQDKIQKTYQHDGCENKQMQNLCNPVKNDPNVDRNPPQFDREVLDGLYINKNENLQHEDASDTTKDKTSNLKNKSTSAFLSMSSSSRSENPNVENESSKAKYTCETCPYVCQSPAILKIHERVHSGEKPFSCTFCDYKSGQKNNVAKHVLVHMKKKPYSCQFCDYKCAQKNNLVVHERTHTGIKPFACTFCEYKTVQKPNLVKHMYLHTNEKPFACDMCDYRCVQKTNLTKHKQKHTMEKPYECSDCDYKSSQKSNLNKHQLIHYKNKALHCELCPYKCLHIEDMDRHRLNKHGVKKREVVEDVPTTAMLHDNINMYNNHSENSQFNMMNPENVKCENGNVNF